MKITLKDGPSRDVPVGQSVGVALSIVGVALGPDIVAAKVNGMVVDLSRKLSEDATLEPLRFASSDGREVYRHTSTHIMAQAVKELFPKDPLTNGAPMKHVY